MKEFNTLIGAKAPFAMLTFASAMNCVANITRVFDPRFRPTTMWTLHAAPLFGKIVIKALYHNVRRAGA
jgi:hypothetical protein